MVNISKWTGYLNFLIADWYSKWNGFNIYWSLANNRM